MNGPTVHLQYKEHAVGQHYDTGVITFRTAALQVTMCIREAAGFNDLTGGNISNRGCPMFLVCLATTSMVAVM